MWDFHLFAVSLGSLLCLGFCVDGFAVVMFYRRGTGTRTSLSQFSDA